MPWSDTLTKPFSAPEDDARLAAWLDERCGRLTASRMSDAMLFLKNGSPSQKRKDYMIDLLTERLTDISVNHYVTPAMQWGLDKEPEAKLFYTRLTGNKLFPAEFIEHPTIDSFGATPDAFISNDGLLEAKCPTTGTFVEWRMAGVVPDEYKPQMLAQLACTGRKWVDFFAYDPRIKEESKRYFLRRFEPNPSDITSIELLAVRFLDEVDELWQAFVTA